MFGKILFFQKTFLLANLRIEVILEMPFFIFNNINVSFAEQKLVLRLYTASKALSITKQIEIINKNKFTKAALDKNVKAFVVYVTSFSLNLILTNLTEKAPISLLVAKKVKILTKYFNFLDVF